MAVACCNADELCATIHNVRSVESLRSKLACTDTCNVIGDIRRLITNIMKFSRPWGCNVYKLLQCLFGLCKALTKKYAINGIWAALRPSTCVLQGVFLRVSEIMFWKLRVYASDSLMRIGVIAPFVSEAITVFNRNKQSCFQLF